METHSCDSARNIRDCWAESTWMQMHACVPETPEWWRFREELYEMYEVLSFSFGEKYFPNKRLTPEDIRQCCRIGVIRAINAWDPVRGSLTTMIAYWVSNEIRAWLRAEQQFRSETTEDHDSITQDECQVGHVRKCDLTYVSFEDLNYARNAGRPSSFLDVDTEQSIESHEAASILTITVEQALDELDPEKREIVERYYGLNEQPTQTLRELGPLFGATHQTIKNRLKSIHATLAPAFEGYA